MTSALIDTNIGGVIMRERNWCTATHMNETFTFRLHASAMNVMHDLHNCNNDMETECIDAASSDNKSGARSPTQLLDCLTESLRYMKHVNIEHEESTCDRNEQTLQNNLKMLTANSEETNYTVDSVNKYTLEKSDVLVCIAQAVYVPLEVEISMLDDPTSIPQEKQEEVEMENENDQEYTFNMDVMVDKWTPLHLALVTQHSAFVKEIIEFHTRYGVWLLQQVCAFNNSYNTNSKCEKEGINAECGKTNKAVKCCMSTLFADTPVLLKGESGNDDDNGCNEHKVHESNSERSHTMHTECYNNDDKGVNDDENNNIICVIKDCFDLTVEIITSAMKPLVEMLVKYYKYDDQQSKQGDKTEDENNNKDNNMNFSFIHEIVEFMHMYFAEHNSHNELTCIIDSDVFCKCVIQENWLHSLQRLLNLFQGALSPVLHGIAIPQSIWHHLSLLPHRPSSAIRRRASNLSFCSSSSNNSRSRNSSMDRMTRSFTPVRNTSFSVTNQTTSASNNICKDADEEKKKTMCNSKTLENKPEINSHQDQHELSAKESLEQQKHTADNPLLVPLEIQHSTETPHINPSFAERNKMSVHNAGIRSSFSGSNNSIKDMCTDVEAFWWDCGPQEIHKLLLIAMVLECRARSVEPVGPTHLHRFGRLLHDVHRLLTIHIKLMSLVATEHSTDKAPNYTTNNNNIHDKDKSNSTPHLTGIHEKQQQQSHHYDEIIPHNTIWSTHLLLLSLWLSKECTVEKMVDLIGDENVSLVISSPGNVPVAFTLLLALGEYVTSFITQFSSFSFSSITDHCVIDKKKFSFAEEVQHIRCKINVLLSEGHQRGPSLRQFITTGLLNQSDRFRELWLEEYVSNNNYENNDDGRCVKKFKTRVEMLHYAVVERLLKSLENMSYTIHHHSSAESDNVHKSIETNNKCQLHQKDSNAENEVNTHEGEAAIFDYLKMWNKYFVSLEEYASKHNVYSNDSNKYIKSNEEKNQQEKEEVKVHSVEQNSKICMNSNTHGFIHVNQENSSIESASTKQEMENKDEDDDLNDELDENEEQIAHHEVCESLHIINSRFLPLLKYGKGILPTLAVYFDTHNAKHDRVLSNVSFRATNTNANTSKVEGEKMCKGEEEKHDNDDNQSSNNIIYKSEKELDDRFVYAQTEFAQRASHCPNEVKLKFYGLYKQAIDGDVNKSAPWRFDLVGRAKWEAWNALRGMSKDEAKREYIKAFDNLRMSNITN